jgi:hypothetical protein
MPDYFQTREERYASRRRHAFWDQWDNDEEELQTIDGAARDLLSALENHRSSTYVADDVAKIDHLAADIAGNTFDWLRARIKQCKVAADDVGIPPEQVDIDTSLLCEEADKWIERSKARAA